MIINQPVFARHHDGWKTTDGGITMGQKVNPVGFRTGIMIGWKSRWYASKKEFSDLLLEDHKIRKFVNGEIQVCRHPQDRDRADARRSEGDPARRPAGRDHRPQGSGSRAAAGRAAKPGRPADQHQDRGNHAAGDSGPAGGRRHRRAAGQAGQLPPHDEAGDGTRRWKPAPRESRFNWPAGWADRKWRAAKKQSPARFRFSTLRAKIDYGFTEAKTAQGKSASRCGSTKACTRTRPMALMPKRVKHRKSQRGRIKGNATRGNRVVFGEFGLQAIARWLGQRPDDRSRTYCGHAIHPRRRAAVHPRIPAQVDHVDPARNPHG